MSAHFKNRLVHFKDSLRGNYVGYIILCFKKLSDLTSDCRIECLVYMSRLPLAMGPCQGNAVYCQLLSKECSLLLYFHFTSLKCLDPRRIVEQPSI